MTVLTRATIPGEAERSHVVGQARLAVEKCTLLTRAPDLASVIVPSVATGGEQDRDCWLSV